MTNIFQFMYITARVATHQQRKIFDLVRSPSVQGNPTHTQTDVFFRFLLFFSSKNIKLFDMYFHFCANKCYQIKSSARAHTLTHTHGNHHGLYKNDWSSICLLHFIRNKLIRIIFHNCNMSREMSIFDVCTFFSFSRQKIWQEKIFRIRFEIEWMAESVCLHSTGTTFQCQLNPVKKWRSVTYFVATGRIN